MSTQQVIAQIESMPLSDRVAILEALVQSIKHETVHPNKEEAQLEEIRRRRREFRIRGFHLGSDVVVDRDEMYSERGI